MKYLRLLFIPILIALAIFGGVFLVSEPAETAHTPNEPPLAEAPVVTPVQPPTVEELLRLTNEERVKAGVKPLELNPLLNKSAQMKAEDMLANGYFAHDNPSSGKHGYSYITDVGVSCYYASENITQNIHVNNSQFAINAWMRSDSHRNALLNARYEQVGFGIADNYVVQHFCDL